MPLLSLAVARCPREVPWILLSKSSLSNTRDDDDEEEEEEEDEEDDDDDVAQVFLLALFFAATCLHPICLQRFISVLIAGLAQLYVDTRNETKRSANATTVT